MPIYLDHAATTPLRREVVDAMLPYLTEHFGNPSSAHFVGRTARAALDEAHERLAARLHADPRELVFTRVAPRPSTSRSRAPPGPARRAVTASSPARSSTTRSARAPLPREVRLRDHRSAGRPLRPRRPRRRDRALTEDDPRLAQLGNNEVGTIQPIADDRERVATAGRASPRRRRPGGAVVDLDVRRWMRTCCDRRPQVRGAQGRRRPLAAHGDALLPQLHGGSQERYRRAGTEDVAAAVGMAVAYDLACRSAPRRSPDSAASASSSARDAGCRGVELTGHPTVPAAGPAVGGRPWRRGRRRSSRRSTSRGSLLDAARHAPPAPRSRQSRPDARWAFPTRRRAAPCGCASAGRRPRPRSRGGRSCRPYRLRARRRVATAGRIVQRDAGPLGHRRELRLEEVPA